MHGDDLLTALRGAVRHMAEVGHALDERESQCVRTVVELFSELDGYLSGGGTPPEVWREGPDAVGTQQDEVPSSQGPDAPAEEAYRLLRGDGGRWYVFDGGTPIAGPFDLPTR